MPTWDVVLLVFFAASLVYGFLLGKDKMMITILGAYVGLVIANQWGARVFELVSQQSGVLDTSWMQGSLSIFVVKTALFALVILIIALKGGWLAHPPGNMGIFGTVMPVVYSMLNAALISASILDFLPEETLKQVIEKSVIAGPLVAYYSWWLILPVVFILVSGWLTRE
ncbi:MAG: hypothetical protein WC805_01930 [Patescibacteria group bacterium]